MSRMFRNNPDGPPIELVRKILAYDPESGEFTWRVRRGGKAFAGTVAGCVNRQGYRVIAIGNTLYPAHRLAWLIMHAVWPKEIDHINGERSNNRLSNLRPCTRSQNLANKRPHLTGTSKLKGVYFSRAAGKWVARITVNYKGIYLGVFENEQDAHEAYCIAAREYRGEFARFA